jgi:hypothetical protein
MFRTFKQINEDMDMKVLRERAHMDEIVIEERAAMFRTVKQVQDESDQKLRKEHNDMDNIQVSSELSPCWLHPNQHSFSAH